MTLSDMLITIPEDRQISVIVDTDVVGGCVSDFNFSRYADLEVIKYEKDKYGKLDTFYLNPTSKVLVERLKENRDYVLNMLDENEKHLDDIGNALRKVDADLHGWFYTILDDIKGVL